MIIGAYPCCGETLMLALPDAQLPRFARHICEGCGAPVWTWLTRLNPQTWTEESFLENFEIDHEGKSIKVKESSKERVMEEFSEIALQLGLIHD